MIFQYEHCWPIIIHKSAIIVSLCKYFSDCFFDNTVYYATNTDTRDLNVPHRHKLRSTHDCQRLCQNWRHPTCRFWSFEKTRGYCFLKENNGAKPWDPEEFAGNNINYASGTSGCRNVVSWKHLNSIILRLFIEILLQRRITQGTRGK